MKGIRICAVLYTNHVQNTLYLEHQHHNPIISSRSKKDTEMAYVPHVMQNSRINEFFAVIYKFLLEKDYELQWMKEIITQVDFTLSAYNNEQNIMDDKTVFEAADFLKMQIRDKKLRLTDLNGQLLMTANVAYGSMEDNSLDISLVILVLLSIILFMIAVLVLILVYFARRIAKIANGSSDIRNKVIT
ncbi:hypothetical protein TNCT_545081 [Trichonephila clavata]|uniref:Uncharacterized protein n=1 Tax=Trichonephila clavata TaxID=2740835 RepID=A0A8X6G3I8_TRICU|nr:hypothetical protein TNCT_545081 [Trichonephila clavata]